MDADPGGARPRRPSGIPAQRVRGPRGWDPGGGCALRVRLPRAAPRPRARVSPDAPASARASEWTLAAVGVCARWRREEKLSCILRLGGLFGKSPGTLGDTGWEGRKRPARENWGHLRPEPVRLELRDKLKEAELDPSGEALQTPESP